MPLEADAHFEADIRISPLIFFAVITYSQGDQSRGG